MMDENKAFDFPSIPTEICFGFGTLNRLPEKIEALKGTRALIVTDRGLAQAGLVGRVEEILARADIPCGVYNDVPQDSGTEAVASALEQLKDGRCDIIVGLGGGSAMDTAKAVAVAKTNPGPLLQYAGLDKLTAPPLPVIAVPTTAGTGSEVSFWSVLTDDSQALKIGIGGSLVFPKAALCDPDLTLSLPPHLTATTGMDALTHAIESYTNRSYQPISEVLALRAMELIAGSLRAAVRDGGNRKARYALLLGSTLAGIAMNPTRLGIAHALAMPLGSWHLRIPHGVVNAVLLPLAMEFNLEGNETTFSRVARALGEETEGLAVEEAALRSVQAVRRLNEDIGIPKGLQGLGLKAEDVPGVVDEAMKSGNITANPRDVHREQLLEICMRAL